MGQRDNAFQQRDRHPLSMVYGTGTIDSVRLRIIQSATSAPDVSSERNLVAVMEYGVRTAVQPAVANSGLVLFEGELKWRG